MNTKLIFRSNLLTVQLHDWKEVKQVLISFAFKYADEIELISIKEVNS